MKFFLSFYSNQTKCHYPKAKVRFAILSKIDFSHKHSEKYAMGLERGNRMEKERRIIVVLWQNNKL